MPKREQGHRARNCPPGTRLDPSAASFPSVCVLGRSPLFARVPGPSPGSRKPGCILRIQTGKEGRRISWVKHFRRTSRGSKASRPKSSIGLCSVRCPAISAGTCLPGRREDPPQRPGSSRPSPSSGECREAAFGLCGNDEADRRGIPCHFEPQARL